MTSMPRILTRGMVYIHSTPSALCPHVVWALESVLGTRVVLDWTDQPAAPGLVRADFAWTGEQGSGAHITSALRGFEGLRYEVTEEPSAGVDGSRWSHTPSLGVHHVSTSANGDIVVGEDRLREVLLLAQGSSEAVFDMLEELMGRAHDTELEVFRHASDGATVRWMHKVG